jgi:hypothetical protein
VTPTRKCSLIIWTGGGLTERHDVIPTMLAEHKALTTAH